MEDKARYIDIKKVTIPKGFFNQDLNVPKLFDWLYSQPAADVVEVVRCKDCKHFLNDTDYCQEHNKGYCEWDNTIKSRKHFCSYGTRKTD